MRRLASRTPSSPDSALLVILSLVITGIWISGQRNGKVGYDLDRIETWQRERTAQIVRDLEAAK